MMRDHNNAASFHSSTQVCVFPMSTLAFAGSLSHLPLARPSLFCRTSTTLQRRPRAVQRQCPQSIRAHLVRANEPHDNSILESFAEKIRGEWDGYEGNFDSGTGAPEAVPDYYIPDQFVEWGIVPLGFESTHSVIVRGTKLYRKFFRVLPSVSLFADHVDLEEDFQQLDIAAEAGAHVFPDGSFATGPEKVCIKRESLLDKWPMAEMCLHDPREDVRNALHVKLKFDFEKRELVDSLRAVVEKWSCVYCDGANIEGSSGFVKGWVSDDPSHPSALAGSWKAVSAGDEQIVDRAAPQSVPSKHLFLPNGIDVAVLEGDGVHVQVGWLVDEATRVVMRRSFGQDGSVVSSQRIVEHRV
ncbi:unnamed protein product [Chondrus crispus]|uniref:DUF3598 domain-containing protein n=1 Tax=Chondrus crispus TaxID=2769 RepID=R7QIL8_CHOCR|nr:unnamed protein product [Chondrus crispus]CDF37588.1 unnamed protein product [Chondrus crispus]|eukprot:XP_005717459.1 unnamed protein product [Chondrus crispus]